MPMSGYTKLFHSILASTIWREPDHVRLVWITLLAMADKHGVAEGSVPGLADFAHVSLERCEDALTRLQSPDSYSRNQDYDGRRIMPIDGGWQLLNHAKYRARLNDDERREYLRIKQAEYRRKTPRKVKPSVSNMSTVVNNVSDKSTVLTQAEAEAETQTDQKKTKNAPTARGASVVSPLEFEKLQRHNAYVGVRLRVPHKLHADFVALLGGEGPDGVLRAWYAELDTELEGSKEPIIPDVWKWLEARFKPWATSRVTDDVLAKWVAGEYTNHGT